MSEEQNSSEEPEQTVRGLRPPAQPRPSEERGDDAATDERTSPFPYAENFEEWVADETTAPGGAARQRGDAAG